MVSETEHSSSDRSAVQSLFGHDDFLDLAQKVLSELCWELLKYRRSHKPGELQMFNIWQSKLPSFRDHVLAVLFAQFPMLEDAFDRTETARALYTGKNLEALEKKDGVKKVARAFEQYFSNRAAMIWIVLVKASENLQFLKEFQAISAEDSSTALRQLTDDERNRFPSRFTTKHRLDAFYFVTTVQAGDSRRAVDIARAKIAQFIAPYYLYRMKNPDRWWRAHTARQILSPVSFFYNPDSQVGVRRELQQLKTEAHDLFTPSPPMEPQWRAAVDSLVGTWDESPADPRKLETHLRLCARWMFAAESEENMENAFLKHCVAWEALLPKTPRARRSWYLLLLCAGSWDPLCIATVSQGERLIHRRNSFAHPENRSGLGDSVEQDLYVLKQSLRQAFDSALQVRQAIEQMGDDTCEWKRLLWQSFDLLCAKSPQLPTDSTLVAFFSILELLNPERYSESGDPLSEVGYIARVEALALKSRECWKADPGASIRHLARGYADATRHALSPNRLHLTLWLRRCLGQMDEESFKKAWSASGVRIRAPSASNLETIVEEIHRKHGLRPANVGWRE